MGKTTEIAIGIPNEIANEIDKLLESKEIRILGITSRRQFTIIAIKKFTDYLKNPSLYMKEEKANEIQRLYDYFKKNIAEQKKKSDQINDQLKEKLLELDRIKESRLDDEAAKIRDDMSAAENVRQMSQMMDMINELKTQINSTKNNGKKLKDN